MFLGPHVGAQHPCTCPPWVIKGEARNVTREKEKGKEEAHLDSSTLRPSSGSQVHTSSQAQYITQLSTFRTRGVPGPTSKLSPRAPAQMGRRETEREGGKKPEGDMRKRGNPRPSCLSRTQVGCACSRGLQASTWERARGLCAPSHPSPVRPTLCKRALDLPFIGVRRRSRCTMGGVALC
jgi:hypothetical protein